MFIVDQVRNQIPEITNMMLVRSLDTLLSENFISKSVSGNKAPFHSKYYLTDTSKELLPLLLKLNTLENDVNIRPK